MPLRVLERVLRFRRVLQNPWTAATARSRGRRGELVPLRLRRGGTLWIRSRTSDIRVFKDVFIRDVYRLSPFFSRTAADGPLECVVDVGGHIGMFSARAAEIARRVIACEPFPANAALFRRNMESSGRRNVRLLELAVNSSGQPLTLYTSRNTAGHSAFPDLTETDAAAEVVSSTTLAEVFGEGAIRRCDLLKLDCEGAEYDILFSATQDLLARIDRIALEYHAVAAQAPRDAGEELERHLLASGFTVDRNPSRRHASYGLLFAWRGSSW